MVPISKVGIFLMYGRRDIWLPVASVSVSKPKLASRLSQHPKYLVMHLEVHSSIPPVSLLSQPWTLSSSQPSLPAMIILHMTPLFSMCLFPPSLYALLPLFELWCFVLYLLLFSLSHRYPWPYPIWEPCLVYFFLSLLWTFSLPYLQ